MFSPSFHSSEAIFFTSNGGCCREEKSRKHWSLFTKFCLQSPQIFLVADKQLYKRLCLSVGRSVGQSVEVNELKSGKKSVLEVFCKCVYVGRGVGRGVGCGWGLAAPAYPSATIL